MRWMLIIVIFASVAYATDPVLHFSDLIDGPKTGLGDGLGEGVIVTVWGNNLGSPQGTSKIYYNDSTGTVHEAAYVYYWKNAEGTQPGGPSDLYIYHKMQEIAFSIPSSAADGDGKIYVEVDNLKSTELNFTIREGNIYFVSVNGTGNGSFENPISAYDFIEKIKSTGGNEDGVTGYFMSGEYSGEYAHPGWHANFCLTSEHSGVDGYENTFLSYPGERVSIKTNGSADRSNFRITNNETKYFIVSKFNLSSENGAITGHTGWRIISNYINAIHTLTGSGSIGTGVYQDASPEKIHIYGNTITGGSSGNKLDHAIYPGSGVNDLFIGWNHIYGNNFSEGPMISLNSNDAINQNLTSRNIIIHDNVIDMSMFPSRAMGVFETGHNSTITYYNNIVIGPSYYASPAVYAMSGNVEYYNNILYNCGSANLGSLFSFYSSVAYDNTYAPESIILKNNILYANQTSSYYVKVTGVAPEPLLENNLYYGIGDFTGNDSNAVNSDPLFTDTENGDFTLQKNSPGINNGTSSVSSVVTRDIVGTVRPQGEGYDIGVFEYVSGFHDADTDENGNISTSEIRSYITQWKSSKVLLASVADAISIWKS